MPKAIQLTISYNENIRFSYTVDTFNQRLDVKLGKGVPDIFMKDAVCEAYDHYNSQHRDAEFIHPDSVVVELEEVDLTGTFPIEEVFEKLDKAMSKFWLQEIEKAQLKEDEFRCAVCQGVYVKSLTEEEATDELQREFGKNVDTEDCDVVCHTCYEKIMQSIKN